jgi:hypothetical protein
MVRLSYSSNLIVELEVSQARDPGVKRNDEEQTVDNKTVDSGPTTSIPETTPRPRHIYIHTILHPRQDEIRGILSSSLPVPVDLTLHSPAFTSIQQQQWWLLIRTAPTFAITTC